MLGECQVVTSDKLQLPATLDPELIRVLSQTISREPLAPASRDEDPVWNTVLRWVVNGLKLAEHYDITRAKALDVLTASEFDQPGKTGTYFRSLQVEARWMLGYTDSSSYTAIPVRSQC